MRTSFLRNALCSASFTVCAAGLSSCAPLQVVALPSATFPADNGPLLVSTRSDVADPLRIAGTSVAYSGLESALREAAAQAALPWSLRHLNSPLGFALLVELTAAEARKQGTTVATTLSTRVTLRSRAGNQHLAQGLVFCEKKGAAAVGSAAPIFQACLHDLSRELERWLAGTTP